MGTEFDGDCLSKGINFMGLICPVGQEVGDRKSGDQMGLGPNASQPLRQFIFFLVKGQEKNVFTTDLCLAHSGRNQCDEKETTISSSGGRINCSILGTG